MVHDIDFSEEIKILLVGVSLIASETAIINIYLTKIYMLEMMVEK